MIKILLIGLFVWVLIEIAEFFKSGGYNHQVALNLFKIMCIITGIIGIFVIHFVKKKGVQWLQDDYQEQEDNSESSDISFEIQKRQNRRSRSRSPLRKSRIPTPRMCTFEEYQKEK